MRILDAALAFVICLAGFATIITVCVEIFHHTWLFWRGGTRASGLQEVLEAICVENIMPTAKANKSEHKKVHQWVSSMIRPTLKEDNPLRWYPPWLSMATELTLQDFLTRLSQNAEFKALAKTSTRPREELLADIGEKYKEYGEFMTNYFRRRAQVISLLAGIALAVVANIDGIRLFERFLNDPALTARVEAQAKQLEGVIKTAQEKTNELPTTQESTAKELTAASTAASQLLTSYSDIRLPIGWTYFPMCAPSTDKEQPGIDPRCPAPGPKSAQTDNAIDIFVANMKALKGTKKSDLFTWLLRTVMTGFLIGLGGPFWFDVAKKITSLRGGDQQDKKTAKTS